MEAIEARGAPRARRRHRARRRLLSTRVEPLREREEPAALRPRTARRGPLALALGLSLVGHAAAVAWLASGAAPPAPGPAAPLHWVRLVPAAAPPAPAPAQAPPPRRAPAPPPKAAAPAVAEAGTGPPAAAESAPASDAPQLAESAPASDAPQVAESAPVSDAPAVAAPDRATALRDVAAAPPVTALANLRLLRERPPRYPRAARLRGAEGVTWLRVRVERSGRVGEVRVERSAGDADLDRAAREAIHRWRFAALHEDTSGLWVRIPIEFRLR